MAKTENAAVWRDYVQEAYDSFIKSAGDIDPTDPVKAVEAYFRKNATDELKARCKAEGKDAKGCWVFVEAVARKALGERDGHIDPGVVYAIAMHYFEDVPADWRVAGAADRSDAAKPKKPTKRQADNSKAAKPKKPAETPAEIRKEKAKAKAAQKRAKAPESAKPAQDTKPAQGFFFNLLGFGDGAESEAAK